MLRPTLTNTPNQNQNIDALLVYAVTQALNLPMKSTEKPLAPGALTSATRAACEEAATPACLGLRKGRRRRCEDVCELIGVFQEPEWF